MSKARTLVSLIFLAGLACLLGGCADKTAIGRFTITIDADADLKENITIDLVAVPGTDFPTWSSVNMDTYARPNPLRDEARKEGRIISVRFSAADRTFSAIGNPASTQPTTAPTPVKTFTITPKDPIFDSWTNTGGQPKLFIMANLSQDKDYPKPVGEGNLDFRRRILPMEAVRWPDNQIKIIISPNKIRLAKDPEPESK